MTKLTILVDMDDTLENLCEVWVGYLNETYGTDVKLEDVTQWDMTKVFPTLNRNEIFDVLTEEALWERIEPLPGAVEYLKKLIDDGHKIVIVTSASPETVSLKLNKVLFKYFPYLTYKDVIITSQKQMVIGDVLVDDAPHNLENGNYLKLLFDASHNQTYDSKDVVRVRNWEETYEAINYYAHIHKPFTEWYKDRR